MYVERDKDYQNYEKANYYNYKKTYENRKPHYENEMKKYQPDDKVKIIMTHSELEKLMFEKVMNAQEHLLDTFMPRFRSIDAKLQEIEEEIITQKRMQNRKNRDGE